MSIAKFSFSIFFFFFIESLIIYQCRMHFIRESIAMGKTDVCVCGGISWWDSPARCRVDRCVAPAPPVDDRIAAVDDSFRCNTECAQPVEFIAWTGIVGLFRERAHPGSNMVRHCKQNTNSILRQARIERNGWGKMGRSIPQGTTLSFMSLSLSLSLSLGWYLYGRGGGSKENERPGLFRLNESDIGLGRKITKRRKLAWGGGASMQGKTDNRN